MRGNYAIILAMIRIATFLGLCLATLVSSGEDFCVTGRVAVVNCSETPRVYLMNKTPPSCFWAPASSDLSACRPGDVIVARGHSRPISALKNNLLKV